MKYNLAVVALLAALLVVAQPLAPALIIVDGTCTLVDAIGAANSDSATGLCPAGSGADEIQLNVDTSLAAVDNSLDGPNGLPAITSDVTVRGMGVAPRIVERFPTAPDFRLFHVTSSGILRLENVVVRNGKLDPDLYGGGIELRGSTATATLTDSRVESNTAGSGGGIASIGLNASLTLTNTTVSGNSATTTAYFPYVGKGGGGVFSGGSHATVIVDGSTIADNYSATIAGGLNVYFGTATITESSVSGNQAVEDAGGLFSAGTTAVTASTISGNSAGDKGGGMVSYWYAPPYPTLNVTNSTISGNTAGTGGALWTRFYSTVYVSNSTLADNVAGDGAGVFNASSDVHLIGTLVANGSSGGNCAGAAGVIDDDYNLADDTTCGTIPGNLTGLDPILADNGGPTMTHALFEGSNAIDGMWALLCPREDQRGAERFLLCDIGACEFIPCPDLVLSDDTVTDTETFENCQRIVVGPDFVVAASGDLTLQAGKSVALGNGTSIETGGQLALEIDPDLQLIPPT